MALERAYHAVNDTIVDILRLNIVPWIKPFNRKVLPFNAATKKPYRGINLFLLNTHNYQDPRFITWSQANKLDGYCDPKAKRHLGTFWNYRYFDKTTGNELTEHETKLMPDENIKKNVTLQAYEIMNYEAFEGIISKRVDLTNNPQAKGIIVRDDEEWLDLDPTEPYVPNFNENLFNVTKAEKIIAKMPNLPTIVEVNHIPATYSRTNDVIHMPKMELFNTPSEYYAYKVKLLIASTGHRFRLNRYYKNTDALYAYNTEQLISCMGAAILCGHIGIKPYVPVNLDKLVKDWISIATSGNYKYFIDAASKAQQAVDHILNK
ncbi:MAG: zincin-like metallopeptidase domain-containing protein [Reichenbachiella sp.]|uniref:zincin-like metallopeptidase domain-containing protein n=1 Tax=Reichenbachiella sp. TaxID=2184521 RepID=UPI003265B715